MVSAMKKTEVIKLSLTEKDVPWLRGKHASNSVDEVSIINFVQFLRPNERIEFVNDLWRILKVGAKAQIITPHWCSSRAFSDLAFQHPPVAEGWYFHLNREWREKNAAWGKAYRCNFDITFGYGLHQLVATRNGEYQQHAVTFFKEAAQDVIATLTKLEK